MSYSKEIIKIRNFGLISFLLPIIAINTCLLLFKFFGKTDLYFNYEYDKPIIEYTAKQYQKIANNEKTKTFTNCPRYKIDIFITTTKGERIKFYTSGRERFGELKNLDFVANSFEKSRINFDFFEKNQLIERIEKYELVEKNGIKDTNCIKNKYIPYLIFKKFPKLEQIFIVAKKKSITGFGHVKNPYLYGEVSISRTARYYPATLLFKPLIVLSAIFLFLYWRNNLNLLNKIKNNNNLKDFSKSFFYLGVLSCIFLTIHAIFLGIDFDSKLFKLFRRLVITFFIFFEIFAQIYLVKNLYNYKNEIKNLIYPVILNSKIIFVIIMLITTLISFAALAANIVEDNFKHVLEWNYFSILLIYYFLSRIMWKAPKKNQAHTPFGA